MFFYESGVTCFKNDNSCRFSYKKGVKYRYRKIDWRIFMKHKIIDQYYKGNALNAYELFGAHLCEERGKKGSF